MSWEYCWTDSLIPLESASPFNCRVAVRADRTTHSLRYVWRCKEKAARPPSPLSFARVAYTDPKLPPPKANTQPGDSEERTSYSSPSVPNCPRQAKIGLKWGTRLSQFWRALHPRRGILFFIQVNCEQ